MNVGKTLLAQIMFFMPWTSFARIVARYGGDSGMRRLSCTEQFRTMLHRAVSHHGLCSTHLPRESARYRGLSVDQPNQAVCNGLSCCSEAVPNMKSSSRRRFPVNRAR